MVGSTVVCESVTTLRPSDVAGYSHVHLFAGIGGWPAALRLARWPVSVPVWTASFPCQPFSLGGQQRRFDDPRDLWPACFPLFRECRPATLFGEQVAGPHGWAWAARARSDLETEGYRFAAVEIEARVVGAPHKRARIFWVADTLLPRTQGLVEGYCPGRPGQWLWGGEKDLQAIAESPRERGDRWPQPIICGMDDGLPSRVVRLHGYGNSIVPQVGALFIQAYLESSDRLLRPAQ